MKINLTLHSYHFYVFKKIENICFISSELELLHLGSVSLSVCCLKMSKTVKKSFKTCQKSCSLSICLSIGQKLSNCLKCVKPCQKKKFQNLSEHVYKVSKHVKKVSKHVKKDVLFSVMTVLLSKNS